MNKVILISFLLFHSVMSQGAGNLIKNNSFQAEFFLEANVLTGVVCSHTSNPYIDIKKGNYSKRIYPGFIDQQNTRAKNKFAYDKCKKKFGKISYFSSRISNYFLTGSSWKLAGSLPFSPKKLLNNKGIGILYHTWHCPVSKYKPSNVFNINDSLYGNKSWGPIGWPHWVGQPIDGYYCLYKNKNLIKRHAILLKNAGVDYIYIDITNWPVAYKTHYQYTDEFNEKIHKPIQAILNSFKELEASGIAVPKIVPWIGASTVQKGVAIPYSRSVSRWLKEYFLKNSKGYTYKKQGSSKPLVLVKVANVPEKNSSIPRYAWQRVKNAINKISSISDIVPMWGMVNTLKSSTINGIHRNNIWSFLEDCQLTGSQVKRGCQQRKTSNQISVSPAYQVDHMLHSKAKGKRRGRTFYQQYIQAYSSNIKNISITGWNEWIGKRLCYGSARWGTAPLVLAFDNLKQHKKIKCSSGNYFLKKGGVNFPLFVDVLTYDRSRDLEPNRSTSDCYYQLMRTMNISVKSGQKSLPYASKLDLIKYCGFDLRI